MTMNLDRRSVRVDDGRKLSGSPDSLDRRLDAQA
jgi:hypothetical protein